MWSAVANPIITKNITAPNGKRVEVMRKITCAEAATRNVRILKKKGQTSISDNKIYIYLKDILPRNNGAARRKGWSSHHPAYIETFS